jgi:hypothetical protein
MIKKPKTQEQVRHLQYLLIKKRALRETFRGSQIRLSPPEYVPMPGQPRYIIRAMYGPMKGLGPSWLVVYNYEPELAQVRHESQAQPLSSRQDAGGSWGPRQFLFEIFQLVAEYHGDCYIYMVHSDELMTVDSKEFEVWIRGAEYDTASALLEPRRFLGGPT